MSGVREYQNGNYLVSAELKRESMLKSQQQRLSKPPELARSPRRPLGRPPSVGP